MDRFWSFKKSSFGNYDFRKLINTRILDTFDDSLEHIVCDIDKTYLETQFESKIQMLKIAFEEAKDKLTVPGASHFLMAMRWGHDKADTTKDTLGIPRPIHFISASPPQLRPTLEEKLAADGLDWTSDSFKNQVYNLRMGRIDLLRHHVAYKTATLYSLLLDAKPGSKFVLIGDNAEFDSYIYMGLAFFLEGKFDAEQYMQYLLAGGIQSDVATDLKKLLFSKKPKSSIAGVLIREAPGYESVLHPPITDGIFSFQNYFQTLVLMMNWKLIEVQLLPELIRQYHNECGFSRELILSCLDVFLKHGTLEETDRDIVKSCVDRLTAIGALREIPKSRNFLQDFDLSAAPNGDKLIKESLKWAKKLSKDHDTTK